MLGALVETFLAGVIPNQNAFLTEFLLTIPRGGDEPKYVMNPKFLYPTVVWLVLAAEVLLPFAATPQIVSTLGQKRLHARCMIFPSLLY